MSSSNVVAEQGSQPTFGDVRVGIMRIGAKDGRAVAQLAVRSPRDQSIVIVDVGDSLDLGEAGRVRIDAITPGDGSQRGVVQFTFHSVGEE